MSTNVRTGIPELDDAPVRVERTSGDYDDGDRTPPTDEQIKAAVDEVEGGTHVPAAARSEGVGAAVGGLSRFDVARLADVGGLDLAGATPEQIAAHDDLLAAVDGLREAQHAVAMLPVERRDAERAAEQDVATALAAGKPTKPGKSRDWAAEAAHRERVVKVAGSRLVAARQAYDNAASSSLPARREALAAEAAEAHAAVLELLPGAAAAFSRWRAAVRAREAVEAELDPARHARLRHVDPDASGVLGRGEHAMGAAMALARSEHPVLNGSVWDEDPGPSMVPAHVRAWAAKADEAANWWLAQLEHREGYSVSRYTEGMATLVLAHGLQDGPPLPAPWAPEPVRRPW